MTDICRGIIGVRVERVIVYEWVTFSNPKDYSLRQN